MVRKIILPASLWVIALLLLAACKTASKEPPTPTTDPKAVYTAAAQTASARLTERAQLTPTPAPVAATPTPDAALTAAVQTVLAQETQAAPEASPTPTATTSPTPGQTAALNDRAEFVMDVTVPDGTDYRPGDKFTKTWRLKNAGASTWTTDYSFVFISGDHLGGPDLIKLPNRVAPGETVDLSVDLVAPNEARRYRGYWKLLNAAGKFFDDPVYVEIDVLSSSGQPGVTPTTSAASNVTISNMNITVDNASFSGACPHTFNFTANFTLSGPAEVTYRWEAEASVAGFTFNLPPAQSTPFPTGVQTVSLALEITDSVSAWVRLHITAPGDTVSSQVNFSLTCQP